MKRVLLILTVFSLYVRQGHAQQRQTWTEDFDGALPPAGWTVSSSSVSGYWLPNTVYYQPGSSSTNPQSYWGTIPGNPGDSVILLTPVYNCTNYEYVFLRFSHICKVSPNDIVRIEYSIDMGGSMSPWETLSWDTYLGSAANYHSTGFNAASYPQWRTDDSTVFPSQSWWEEELFDLTSKVGRAHVQLRFVIKHGTILGTNASYGWLLDNFRLDAAEHEIYPPTVEFTAPYVGDTVYTTGPFEINARVETGTNAPIKTPWLKYTVTQPGKQAVTDSILMTHIAGNSLWKAAIPKYMAGTQVSYSITGSDTMGNEAMANSGYVIKYFCSGQIAPVIDYSYTGNEQMVMLPAGIYQLECWGAHGWAMNKTYQGKGGYSKGTLTIPHLQTFYIYVGEGGQVPTSVAANTWTFNGGGTGHPVNNYYCGNGGGASDIRTVGGSWDNAASLSSRIIVAGGGGAGRDATCIGGNGGGTAGGAGTSFNPDQTGGPTGGTQSAGGTNSGYASALTAATLGKAMTWNGSRLPVDILVGGGGGYYGGGSGRVAGGGGSGYIGGVTNGTMTTGATDNPSGNNNGYIRITSISIPNDCFDYSAAIHSIDMPDTVMLLPAIQFPVIATIKNVGKLDMDSAIVSYSINNAAPVSKNVYFNPALPWDFIYPDTIGYYSPSTNAFDTVVVWVSLPNGQTDNITRDDTLTKVVYGATDIFMEFVDPPADTVYSTRPNEIKARISTLSGTPLNQVSLDVACTYEGITSHDILTMNPDASDNLWKAIIPKKRAGTDVVYSISLIDISGNNIQLSGSYYIKRADCGIVGGNDNCSDYSISTYSIDMADTIAVLPSTQIPIAATIRNAGILNIDSVIISYSLNSAAPVSRNIYFNPALPWDFNYRDTAGYYTPKVNGFDTVVIWVSLPNGQIDDITGDDTLTKRIYGKSGILANFVNPPADTVYKTGPYEIKARVSVLSGPPVSQVSLDVAYTYEGVTTHDILPMNLDASDNLWKTTIPQKRFKNYVAYSISLTDVSGNNILLSKTYYIKRLCEETNDGCDSNSVALVSIDSPQKTGVPAGNTTPVRITLRNKGAADLDSCYLNWSLNGVLQPGTIVYKDSLPDDFTDTITIGYYTPLAGKRDTLVVWVSMPNGQQDPTTGDDTLKVSSYGCPLITPGAHLVGTGGTFSTLEEALNIIRNCGVSSNLVLQLKGVDTTNVDLSNISDYMQGHTLTITSYDNNPDSATIKVRSGAGIILNKSNNVVIKAITVDVSTAAILPAIQFTGACANVVIRDCKLLGDSTTTSSNANKNALIYKAMSTGMLDSIFIINNLLNGGYNGFNLYAGASNSVYATNIVFDSNTVSNQYYHGILMYWADITTRYNTFLSRTTNGAAANWRAIYMSSTNGDIIGNRVIQRNSANITTPVGIYLSGINYSTTITHDKALIANNEIIIYTTSATTTYSGIYVTDKTNAAIIHNSIYVGGNNGRGIQVANTAAPDIYLTIKNNNIVMESTAAAVYSIRLDVKTKLDQLDIDYNNMYAPTNVGYVGGVCKDIQAWQDIIATDRNSKKVKPVFITSPTFTASGSSLRLANDAGLTCPRITPVTKDILDTSRYPVTSMGCYSLRPINGNGMLTAITGITDGVYAGQTQDVKVVLHNMGATPLTSVNLGWSINDVLQGNADYPVSLQMCDSAIITIASITYPSNDVKIKVWINNLNNNTLVDEKQEDDTVSLSVRVCPGVYGGTLTVGQGGMFPDMQAVYRALELCGLSADITLALMPGIYTNNIDLSDNSTLFGNYKLTLTSSTKSAGDVTIRPPSGVGIILNKTNNVSIEALTIDVRTSGTHGIQISGACSTITVNKCTILGTLGNASSHLITKGTAGDVVSDLCITNNVLDGGYYGIHLAGSSTNYIGNVRIDSNLIQNQYYYGVFANTSADFTSLSCNTILSRETGTLYASWQGIRLLTSRGPVTGNKIRQRNTATITAPYGIYLSNHNNAADGSDLITNNEIMISTTGTYAGLYLDNSNTVSLLHNSVYVGGTGAGRGIYLPNINVDMVVKKNNIIMKSSSSYPVYLAGTSYLSRWDIDYNNMYAPVYVGYAVKGDTTIASWQQTVTSDANSVRILPVFVDTTTLELSLYNDTLQCPGQEILTDIHGYIRLPITTMGAYTQPPTGLDLMVRKLHLSEQEAVTNQDISISIDVWNVGSVAVDNVTFGWSVNGQVQPTTVPYTFTSPLETYQQRNVPVGTFKASGNTGGIDVVAWIETINMVSDPVNWNDTASAVYTLLPLAEFATPFVEDTITSLSFDVYATIFESTGAPVNPPQLYIETKTDGLGTCYIHAYDTVNLIKENNKWVAHIPKQYYNSKVIYELHVSDTVGNNIVLRDSVSIVFGSSIISKDVDYVYTGSVQAVTLNAGTYLFEAWGANGGLGSYASGTVPQNRIKGGSGGYSVGTITLNSTATLYIAVGGKGGDGLTNPTAPGGYNGGGKGNANYVPKGGGGGGATHIATATGTLSSLDGNKTAVMIVAGGGGGGGNQSTGGDGGGTNGIQPATNTQFNNNTAGGGGAQNAVGTSLSGSSGAGFGQGATTTQNYAGGGGGGWYGGGTGMINTGGGGGSGYIGGVVFGASADASQTGFVANPDTSGNGYVRISRFNSEVYAVSNNLAIFDLVSPAIPEEEMCVPTYSPVEIKLSNLGENNYDFSQDNITIGYEITGPKRTLYEGNITIDTGKLLSGEFRIVELLRPIPILAGKYTLKAWVTSVLDHFICDDTLTYTYISGKVGLPVDENFSNVALPSEFASLPVIGTHTWKYCPDTNALVRPVFGTGMLRYDGTYGSMARLNTRQLDLYGAINPKLEFWYYHDTTAPVLDNSFTNVNIVADGNPVTVLSLLRKSNPHGWRQYVVDLRPYTGAQCVFVQFESMNKFGPQSVQYIDRIVITSDQDLEVSEIFITPEITACGLKNKDVYVVIRTPIPQAIDFSDYQTSLAVDIPGYPTFDYPLQDFLRGNTSDTILIASGIDLVPGTKNIRAYLTAPVDDHASNDEKTLPLDIRPAISITAQALSGGMTDCLAKGMEVQQKVTVKNTGNMEISGIELLLNVIASSQQTLTKSAGSLNPGDSTDLIFDGYTVPMDADYQVQIIGYMACDSALVNSSIPIAECVDMDDLAIAHFVKPQDGEIDTMGKSNEIAVYLKNFSDTKDYTNIVITASVEVNGNEMASYKETVSKVGLLDSMLYTFTARYTVPNETEYDIKVFINSKDNYPLNDTLLLRREAIDGDVGVRVNESGIFTLKQNIPNPANNSTVIKYSIPVSGEVIFDIHSISGQLLYTKVLQTESGQHTIEINTSNCAAGIYFYSMEFNGQKISKRMSIKR